MATNYRAMNCSPEDVFRVLGDGWLYPSWVVGASRIRQVDETWPAIGARIRHSVGVWPALIDDSTSVVENDGRRHLRLRARGWPMGEAVVIIDIKKRANGCVVRMIEDAVIGPGVLMPRFLRDIGLQFRNVETLRRLTYLAEGGAR